MAARRRHDPSALHADRGDDGGRKRDARLVARRDGCLRRAEIAARVREASRRFGLDLDPGAVIGDLPLGRRQRVEILKAAAARGGTADPRRADLQSGAERSRRAA